ncbi:MAG: hypothetical protein ACE5JL_08945 [Dehalococcoidia bacterium]
MALEFLKGDPDNPKGHALVYFITEGDEPKVYATYLIVPPINIELAKYMPPMFASKVSLSEIENVSSIPLPPVPEEVEDLDYLKALAESRNDDLIYGGVIDESEVDRMLMSTTEAAQSYLELYNNRPPLPEPVEKGALEVSDVLYHLMSDKDKLSELARQMGSLRYAIEGNDHAHAEEIRREMETLGRYLGEKYKVGELIEVAQTPGITASKLSQLYTERCYKLCDEDYRSVAKIEEDIKKLKDRLR